MAIIGAIGGDRVEIMNVGERTRLSLSDGGLSHCGLVIGAAKIEHSLHIGCSGLIGTDRSGNGRD